MSTSKPILNQWMTPPVNYGLVVVLCAGDPYIDTETDEIFLPETEYQEGDDSNSEIKGDVYVGATLRMQMAIRLAPQVSNMLLVGGSLAKVEAMYEYLTRNGVSPDKLYLLESHPSTLGNMWAIRKMLEQMPEDTASTATEREARRIYILTNAYHQHRAMRFASDIIPFQYQVVPLVAESYLDHKVNKQLMQKEYYLRRMQKEYRGLYDYERGHYQDQDKPEDYWKCIFHFRKSE